MHTKDEVVSKILYFCRYDCSVRSCANVTFLGLQRQNVPILVDRHCPLMMAGREGQRHGSKAIFSMSKPTAGHFCPYSFSPKKHEKGFLNAKRKCLDPWRWFFAYTIDKSIDIENYTKVHWLHSCLGWCVSWDLAIPFDLTVLCF